MGRMTTQCTLLDASALIAYFRGEPGGEVVENAWASDCFVSSAQWAELAAFYSDSPPTWAMASAVLLHFGVTVEPVTPEDAAKAGLMRRGKPSFSLGDRICLATAERLGAQVLTADRAWGTELPIRQIR